MALYVAGYSAFRLFEESLRIDYSVHVLGMRLNFWIALLVCLAGLAWFVWIQRQRQDRAAALGRAEGRRARGHAAQEHRLPQASGRELREEVALSVAPLSRARWRGRSA